MIRELVGFVTSVEMDKTISVLIPFNVKHATYQHESVQIKRLMAHDERQEAETGDCVLVESVKKYSRKKKWQLVKILRLASTQSE